MKLLPRERRERSDFLLENAASLRLGYLYLGWNRKKRSRSKARKENEKHLKTEGPKGKSREKAKKVSQRGPVVQPIPTPSLPPENSEEDLVLAICFVSGEVVEVSVNINSTVGDLKYQIKTSCLQSNSSPSLFANGAKLSPDGSLLRNFGVSNGTIVYCLF